MKAEKIFVTPLVKSTCKKSTRLSKEKRVGPFPNRKAVRNWIKNHAYNALAFEVTTPKGTTTIKSPAYDN